MSDKTTTYNLLSKITVAMHGLTEDVNLEELLKDTTPLILWFEGDNIKGRIEIIPPILRVGLIFKEEL